MQGIKEIGPTEDVIGDDPRWHRFTPLVWQAVAMDFPHNLPSIAHATTFDHPLDAVASPGYITTAQAFSASLQISRYALGWENGAQGFRRWSQLGFEGLTPHLRVIAHLLGSHTQYLADWLGRLHRDGTNPLNTGGYDSYHLEDHSRGPNLGKFETRKGSFIVIDNRRILVTDSYIGWYRLASEVCSSSELDTRGVDVYCTPVGWLGCYKRSATSNVTHCTSEEVHLWDYTS